MKPGVQHLVLTRFNVPDPGLTRDKQGRPVRTPDWMAHRLDLFERFCYPTVTAQGHRGFRWLVFFDEATSGADRRRIAGYTHPVFEPVFIGDTSERIPAILDRVAADTEYLITTRVDNDDAIHRDLTAEVQGEFRAQPLEFLGFPEGYFLCGDDIYHAVDPRNPFVSLIERRAGPRGFRTVWCAAHHDVRRVGPLRLLPSGPRWLRVIHERNASARDPRDPPGGWRRGWGRRVAAALVPWRGGRVVETRTALTLSALRPGFPVRAVEAP